MCGFAGVWSDDVLEQQIPSKVKSMTSSLTHRGPDGEGYFNNDNYSVGHRRLSIIDLSAAGNQPFISDDGRYVLTYNGEIYNYVELRARLESYGVKFKSRTDTEVLLKCYERDGIDCLGYLNGMFAFSVYDTKTGELVLARDRFGIKPLYYSVVGERLWFASEIRALKTVPQIDLSVNTQAVFDYWVFNRTDIYEETFFRNIKRLPKGHYLVCRKNFKRLQRWWQPEVSDAKMSDLQILERTKEQLSRAVSIRMRSDVPVGGCVSGGIDSNLIIGLLHDRNELPDKFNTFTASYPGNQIDETPYVDRMRAKYRFLNHRVTPTAEGSLKKLRRFLNAVEEPVPSPSFFSQYEVMSLAKENGIKVLLDGQGGDEVFGGYQYLHGYYLSGLLRRGKVFSFTKGILQTTLSGQDRSFVSVLAYSFMPNSLRSHFLRRKGEVFSKDAFDSHLNSSLIFRRFLNAKNLSESLALHLEYKLEHLLRVEDRTSMAFSIEARVPYLDDDLVEHLMTIPEKYKVKSGRTRPLQRRLAEGLVDAAILRRKDKIGFAVPTDDWMKTPLWREKIKRSVTFLKEEVSHIFNGEFPEKLSAKDGWKAVQLAEWFRMQQKS